MRREIRALRISQTTRTSIQPDIVVGRHPHAVLVVRVGEAQSCVVSDGYLYAGAWEECRVAICDVRNPARPKQVAEVELNGRGCRGVVAAG